MQSPLYIKRCPPKRRSRAKIYQALPLHFSVGSKVIRNNCGKEGEPGNKARGTIGNPGNQSNKREPKEPQGTTGNN